MEYSTKPKEGEPWEVAIIGSGPAGLTAAIYTSRGAASTIILAGESWGGQLMLTTAVDNFPARPGITGPRLMEEMKVHALEYGALFKQENVTAVDFSKTPFTLTTPSEQITAKSVIIATGADTKWLGIPGEEKLRGRGVSSCAPCDAPFFKGKKVVVVGGGDSAMEEALVLTKYASEVHMIHRRDAFRASAAMQARVSTEEKSGKIKIIWNTEVLEMLGGEKLEKIKIKNVKSGEESEMDIDGVFVAIGHIPATNIFKDKIDLDEKGYVKKIVNNEFGNATSVSGVFVAGDVHDHHYRQAITAAGFGCQAAMDTLKFLDKQAPNW